MKKLCLFLTMVVAGFSVAKAQGLISIVNFNSNYWISTNAGGGVSGRLSRDPNSYFFALLVSSNPPASSNPLTGGWSVAQQSGTNLVANNSTILAGALLNGGSSTSLTIDNWPVYNTNYIELVGWSASLGTTWEQIAGQLQNGWSAAGYYGVSAEGLAVSGGSYDGFLPAPAQSIWGPGQLSFSASLTGIPGGFVLNRIPEPSSLALTGVGGCCLMFFRRRKN